MSALFLKKILKGQKKLLRMTDVRFVKKFISFRELTAKNLIENAPDKHLLKLYLPDISPRYISIKN